MTELPDFLLARIAEDEEIAQRRHITAGSWSAGGLGRIDSSVGTYWRVGVPNRRDQVKVALAYTETRDDANHIARHDPARVLAECEAKRRIVEWHQEAVADQGGVDEDSGHAFSAAYDMACRALATPYADHPDYRQEWKP